MLINNYLKPTTYDYAFPMNSLKEVTAFQNENQWKFVQSENLCEQSLKNI